MGRPSKLTPEQWREIETRLDANESASALAREYGISPGLISQRVSKNSKKVSKAAEKLAEGRRAVMALPRAQQYRAESLADKLVSMSQSLADAGKDGADMSSRLQALALAEVKRIGEAGSIESVEDLKGAAALIRLANDSSVIPRDLLAANKDSMKSGVAGAQIEIVNYAALPQE